MGKCTATIKTLMILGPFLISEYKFCPGFSLPLMGYVAMNKYGGNPVRVRVPPSAAVKSSS